MARNNGARSAPPRRDSSLLTGVVVGTAFGLAIAAGVAWYMWKMPSPFVARDSREAAKPAPAAVKPAPAPVSGAATASGVGEGKPRFEFYKVLTDKEGAAAPAQKNSARPATKGGKPASAQTVQATETIAGKETYFLQAGAFSNAEDADKLKARLAMLGMEASIQAATIPDKGVMHRVRLGPYKGADEMKKMLALLKQNGVDATPIRTQ